jgi:hypothetical protein
VIYGEDSAESVFRDVMLFSLVRDWRRLGSTCCCPLQGKEVRRAGGIRGRHRDRSRGQGFSKKRMADGVVEKNHESSVGRAALHLSSFIQYIVKFILLM